MAQDTKLKQLVINKLTTAQYNAAVQAGTINENQLYMTTDSSIVKDVTVNGVSVLSGDTAAITLGTMANETASEYSKKTVADTLYAAKSLETTVSNHLSASNPHGITKSTVGLGNVDNTSDINKPVSTAQQTALNTKVDKVNTSNKVYGTDSSGVQTTYDKDSFSKVDDVKIGTTSIVANKVVTLGTMATENVANYYNKTEVDGMLSGAMHFKGTVPTIFDLPETGNKVGDMYNVQSTGSNYAWDGTQWDKLSENIDLSHLAIDSEVVHKTGNEVITGIKTFNTAPIFRDNLTPSLEKTSDEDLRLIGISLNTKGDIDGFDLCREVKYNSSGNNRRYITLRSGFRNAADTNNLWTHLDIGLLEDESSFINLGSNKAYGPTPSEDTTSSTQIDTVGARNTKLQSYALDANVVHKTGNESITGSKSFYSNATHYFVSVKDSDQEYTASPSVNHYRGIQITDKNNAEVSFYRTRFGENGVNGCEIGVRGQNGDFATIFLNSSATGQATFIIPTPSEDTTSSTQADTVGARNTKLQSYALDANVVHLAGDETITGTKTFSKQSSHIVTSNPSYEKGTVPTVDTYITHIVGKDKNNNNLIMDYNYIPANSSTTKYIKRLYSTVSSDTNNYVDVITAEYNGTTSQVFLNSSNAFAPTPVAASNTTATNIATVGWVNDPSKSTNVVHRSGNETIGGIKSFTASQIRIYNNSISYTDTTKSQNGQNYINFWATDKQTGYINSYLRSATQTSTSIAAYFNDGTTTNTAELRINANKDGTKTGVLNFHPTDNTTDSYQIATVGWVNSVGNNLVHLTGDETIAGTKTFSSPIDATIYTTVSAGFTKDLVKAKVGTNDVVRIAAGGASNAGYLELATADDYNEPIYVRQYQGGFATIKNEAILLDDNGNTQFPNTVTAQKYKGEFKAGYGGFEYASTYSGETVKYGRLASILLTGVYQTQEVQFMVQQANRPAALAFGEIKTRVHDVAGTLNIIDSEIGFTFMPKALVDMELLSGTRLYYWNDYDTNTCKVEIWNKTPTWTSTSFSIIDTISGNQRRSTGWTFYQNDMYDSFPTDASGYKEANLNVLSIGTPTEDTTSSTQADTVGARNTKLANYQQTITGAATTITSNNLTASRALISNSSGKVAVSDTTSTELGYLHGVTSAVQTQINTKADDSNVVHKTGNETISGTKTFSNDVLGYSFKAQDSDSYGMFSRGYIELSPSNTTNIGGYIDFHYNGNTSDYTSRIIEDASGRLTYQGADRFTDTTATNSGVIATKGFVNLRLQNYQTLNNLETTISDSDTKYPSSSAVKSITTTQTNTISDCILEIPETVKLDITGSTITLKAGSVIRVATGLNDETRTITTDVVKTSVTVLGGNGICALIYQPDANLFQAINVNNITSVATVTDLGSVSHNSELSYVVDERRWYYTPNSGSTWGSNFVDSYPLALINVESSTSYTFVKDEDNYNIIFNAGSVVGHHFVSYPGIKALIANGFNEDGTLKSTVVETTNLYIRELPVSSTSASELTLYLMDNKSIYHMSTWNEPVSNMDEIGSTGVTYVKTVNKNILCSDKSYFNGVLLAKFNINSGIVNNISIRQPIRLASVEMVRAIQDKVSTLDEDVVHKEGNETITGTKTFSREVKMTAGGTSDITSGILNSFKTKYAQSTNFFTQNIIAGCGNSTTHASNLPINIVKYGNISNQQASDLTTLVTFDLNGNIVHYGSEPLFISKINNYDLTNPGTTAFEGGHQFTDSNNLFAGGLRYGVNASGTKTIDLRFKKRDTTNVSIGIRELADGTIQTFTPAPTEDTTSSTQIDTVGARNTKLQSYALDANVIHTSGNETKSGNLTLNNSTFIYKDSANYVTTTNSDAGTVLLGVDTNNKQALSLYTYRGISSTEGESSTGWWFRASNITDSSKYADLRSMVTDNNKQVLSYVSNGNTNLNVTEETNSTTINWLATMGWVNNPETSTNVVHRTGDETIGGSKIFTSTLKVNNSNQSGFVQRNLNIDRGTAPSANQNHFLTMLEDKDGQNLGGIYYRLYTTNKSEMSWYVYDPSQTTGFTAISMGLGYNADGTTYTFAPVPAASNSTSLTNIATVGWVNDPTKSTNVVHRTGDETIGGIKTFTSGTIISKSAPGYALKATNITRATPPSSNQSSFMLVETDNNNKNVGGIYRVYNSDSGGSLSLLCYKPQTTDATYQQIKIGYDASGNCYTYAPTPTDTTSTSGTQIATTGWVNTRLTTKQDNLTAGDGINISNNTISTQQSVTFRIWGD